MTMAVGSGVEVGRRDGRATALAVILPLKPGGRWWLTIWFWVLRRVVLVRRWAFRDLDGLQFIYAIRWSLLSPYEARRRVVPPTEQRWHLLFESNFDGDWDEYLDSFASVMPKGLATMVWAGAGYTGLSSPDLFKRYAKLHDHVPEHYVSGYPGLSANDIRQELVARYGTNLVRGFARDGYSGPEPQWTNLRLPLRPGAEGVAVRCARALDPGGQPGATGLFRSLAVVHFARIVVDQQASRSWLMLTITHDGDARSVVRELLDHDHRVATSGRVGRFHDVLACVGGLGPDHVGAWDDDALAAFLLRHRPTSTGHAVAYCGYPGFTADEVRALSRDVRRQEHYPEWEVSA
jgi:hypothetical protein